VFQAAYVENGVLAVEKHQKLSADVEINDIRPLRRNPVTAVENYQKLKAAVEKA
jgi:hypothetical protein